jgi:hypothetical protein
MKSLDQATACDRRSVAERYDRIQAEFAMIRSSLERLERELARLVDEPLSRPPRRSRSDRYYRLLIEVFERGPHGVSPAELDELARVHGYDRRGVNGCFTGTRAPLRLVDGRVHLTLEARRAVDERLRTQVS